MSRYVLLFIAIQLISLVLTVIGIPVCAFLAYELDYAYDENSDRYHFPRWAWIWDNQEDGVAAAWYLKAHPEWTFPHTVFMWSALRNPCNNLRYVPGVSKIGRPLWRKTWGAKPGGWYVQAGWNASGHPVLSAGRNINPY